jgi:glycosyltransferase 2 family protein
MKPLNLRGRRVATTVNQLFFAGALAFGVVTVLQHKDQLRVGISSIGIAATTASMAFAIAGVALSSQVWRRDLSALGARPEGRQAERVFFTTQIGKYVPGLVWPYAAQLRFARRVGLGKARMLVVQVVFLATHVATGIATGALALPLLIFDGKIAAATAWLILPALGCLALLHPRVLEAIVNRLRKRPADEIVVDGREIALGAATMFATWILYGLSTALLAVPLTTSFGQAVTLAFGGFAVAWVVGFLVLVAPAGVGAREMALVAILGTLLTRSEAASVAVLSRALMTAADLLLAVAAVIFIRRRVDSSEPSVTDSGVTGGEVPSTCPSRTATSAP